MHGSHLLRDRFVRSLKLAESKAWLENRPPFPSRGSLPSSFLEALVNGARPMEIMASPGKRLERVRVLPLSVVES